MMLARIRSSTVSAPANEAAPLWRRTQLLIAYALGAAVLNLLPHWRALLFADGRDQYFLHTPAAHDYIATLLWTFLIAGVVFIMARLIARSSSRWSPWLFVALTGLLAVNALEFVRIVYFTNATAAWLHSGAAVGGVLSLVLIAIWRVCGLRAESLATTLAIVLAVASPFALSTVVQGLARSASLALDPERLTLAAAGEPPASARALPRVAWVIFDELDQRVLTDADAPYPYPHFDSFRARSVEMRQAIPPGGRTIQAMPSYWLGRRLVGSRADGPTSLQLRLVEGGEEIPFSDFHNLFEEIAEDGFESGAVGFYHPYCRLFRTSLRRCASYHGSTPLYFETETLWESFQASLRAFYATWRQRVIVNLLDRIRDAALTMLANPALDFVAIHFSIPHEPPIYDPESDELGGLGPGLRFEGNVVLADKILGLIEERMRAAEVWDDSVLIVGSDHGWGRLAGFDSEPGAVPFLVHMPGQTEGLSVDEPVDALLTRKLILALLRGELATPTEVASFLRSTSLDTNPARRVERSP